MSIFDELVDANVMTVEDALKEKTKQRNSEDIIITMAEALNVSVDELLTSWSERKEYIKQCLHS